MSTPNRRVPVPKTSGSPSLEQRSGKNRSVTSGLAKPSAAGWKSLERKKGRGEEAHEDEVGELIIPSLPIRMRADVIRTIEHVGQEAERRDPKHRILSIRSHRAGVRVTTSENQLVVRIGKKLRDACKGGKLSISYSDEDRPIRVVWTPPGR